MKRRILALALALALLLAAAPGVGAYSDLADAELAARIETLGALGVVNGYPDGSFKPQNTLTRAEFTKMMVCLLGGEDKSELFGAYTIFGDVPSGLWSARYINYAARETEKGGLGLLKGYTDGTFRPENTINFAESVTIILRGLGFSDAEVGYNWPRNFIERAASSGLSANVSRGDYDAISRADAANLFYNALFVERKDGSKLVDSLYGETIASALVVAVDSDGVRIAERPDEVYQNAAGLSSADVGSRKKLVLSSDGATILSAADAKAQTSVKNDAFIYSVKTEDGFTYISLDGSTETICLAAVDATWVARSAKLTIDSATGAVVAAELLESQNRTIAFAYYSGDRVTATSGEVFTVPASTPTYRVQNGAMGAAVAFSAVRDYLSYGDTLELTLGSDGAAKHVVARTDEQAVALVEPDMTFAQLRAALGAPSDAVIYKNGAETEFSALSPYDAASYSPGSKVINVCGFRLTAVYSYATPNSRAPEYITVFGNTLKLAPCAQESVSAFEPNERITLLFAADGRVAGALAGGSVRAVGVYDGGAVEFLGGPTLKMSLDGVESGALVNVGCGADGKPTASKLSERSTNKVLDLDALTLGGEPLALGCAFFERAAAGQTPVRIARGDINRAAIEPEDILHVGYDSSGRANLIIFADVTGDRFDYGRLLLTTEQRTIYGTSLSLVYDARMLTLESARGSSTTEAAQTATLPTDLKVSPSTSYGRRYAWGGVAVGTASSPSGGSSQYVTACKLLDVSADADRASFVGSAAALVGGVETPIASGVQVYLEKTGVFMDSSNYSSALELVSAARAQGENFELYCDASPQDGGKIRVIVVK